MISIINYHNYDQTLISQSYNALKSRRGGSGVFFASWQEQKRPKVRPTAPYLCTQAQSDASECFIRFRAVSMLLDFFYFLILQIDLRELNSYLVAIHLHRPTHTALRATWCSFIKMT